MTWQWKELYHYGILNKSVVPTVNIMIKSSIQITVNLAPRIKANVKGDRKIIYPIIKGRGLLVRDTSHDEKVGNQAHFPPAESQPVRIFKVDSEAVKYWQSNDACPRGIRIREWKRMKPMQRLRANVEMFDEGFGVEFKIID